MSQKLIGDDLELESLLRPISEEAPTGVYLLYEGTYDRIREARRSDDPSLPRDIWQHELKSAEWGRVRDLCITALESKSKDLQIAGWLCEANLHIRGFGGLAEGLTVILGLCERFWEGLHPELDEDGEFRCAPFHWLNEKFAVETFRIPVARPREDHKAAVTWSDWKRAIWLENLHARNPGDADLQRQIEKAVTRDEFTRRVQATPQSFHEELAQSLELCVHRIREIESFLDERLKDRSPSLVRLRENLSEILGWVRTVLRNAAPPEPEAALDEPEMPHMDAVDVGGSEPSGTHPPMAMGEEPPAEGPYRGREDAYRRIQAAARYLRSIEPHSPAPYLIMRAVTWGEKSLSELIVELRRNGFDLESLSSLLGLNEEGDM